MFKKILILAVVLAFVSSAVFAYDTNRRYSGSAERRGIVTEGVNASFEGTLRYEAPLWYLDTASGSYELRLGNRNFISKTGATLAKGAKCSVEGFQAGDDIAVSSMTMDGKTYLFRDQNGKLGFNRSSKPGSDQGRGMSADHAGKSSPGQGGKQYDEGGRR